ncbi:uncharacterized protein [Clytia hemisphaerica]|uniref:Uncharacterized protein n=1 Tax=Clytia hemisphaerica TaxID=252671 RepID=A0A7M5WL43_9CNID
MTRYLSEVSGYYGCQWKPKNNMAAHKEKSYHQMTEILQQRETDCRRLRLSSLFETMPKNDIHIEGYSPSAVRKLRAKTVPPLQNIYEDTIFYPSNWTSPSLTKKQRRERMNKRAASKKPVIAIIDENNNNNNNGFMKKNTAAALRMTEKFETKYHSPQLKRKAFGKHNLIPLPEEKITRSFDESVIEETDEEEEEAQQQVIVRRGSAGERRFRPRSWSE